MARCWSGTAHVTVLIRCRVTIIVLAQAAHILRRGIIPLHLILLIHALALIHDVLSLLRVWLFTRSVDWERRLTAHF